MKVLFCAMEAVILTFITILGIVFTFSFIILIFLCHYKTIRKNASRYVKKLARTDLRESFKSIHYQSVPRMRSSNGCYSHPHVTLTLYQAQYSNSKKKLFLGQQQQIKWDPLKKSYVYLELTKNRTYSQTHKDTELIEKKTGLVKRFLRNPCSNDGVLSVRCQQLLDLCYGLDLTTNMLTQPDIQKIHAIVQLAQSITEDSDDWTCPEGREKAGLLEKRAASLLQQVASVMSAMEAHLSAIEESSNIEEIKNGCYKNSLII